MYRALMAFIAGWVACYVASTTFLDWKYSEKAVGLITAITTSATMLIGIIAVLQPFWLVKKRKIREDKLEIESIVKEAIESEIEILSNIYLCAVGCDIAENLPSDNEVEEHASLVKKLSTAKRRVVDKKSIGIKFTPLLLNRINEFLREVKALHYENDWENDRRVTNLTSSIIERITSLIEINNKLERSLIDRVFGNKNKSIVKSLVKQKKV